MPEHTGVTPTPTDIPILYTFRRCPYAMRGRLGLAVAGITVEIREILLKRKPQPMLDVSPKGTVPVLLLPCGTVIDESADVLHWALTQNDPKGWLAADQDETQALIAQCDGPFKTALDHYKYSVRFPERSQEDYRDDAAPFLQALEARLSKTSQLFGERVTEADAAVFPFVRQFSGVEPTWWASKPYPSVHRWLAGHLDSPLFKRIMTKRKQWLDLEEESRPIIEDWS